MLSTVVIGAGPETAALSDLAFQESGRFGLLRAVDSYPEDMQLERMLRAHAPQVIFLCVDRLQDALRICAQIDQFVKGAPIVAFGKESAQLTLLELMKVGIREFVLSPFDQHALRELADRLESVIGENPPSFDTTDLTFAFLPAKPGVGASTLALNISVAMSRHRKVFLADFDLNSGLVAFMLKIGAEYSLEDAATKSAEIDEDIWPKLVTQVDDLDVLPSGRSNPGFRIDPVQIHHLISFARRQYGVICTDLSGNIEKYSVELMQESKLIFLVTTSEIPPLHLARQRCELLRSVDLADRVRVLLNRYNSSSSLRVSQIEELLGLPVFDALPNDYKSVHQSLVAGKPIDPSTELGRACTRTAERVLKEGEGNSPVVKKGFLDHFSGLGRRVPVRK